MKQINNVSRETLITKKDIETLYKLALKSYKNNEIPVGAIVKYNNKIIGTGYNTRQKKHDICGHAEINAIKMAEKRIKDWRLNDCIIISTLEPCELCTKIINDSRIKNSYYIVSKTTGIVSNKIINEKIYFPGNNFEEKIKEMLKVFFSNIR